MTKHVKQCLVAYDKKTKCFIAKKIYYKTKDIILFKTLFSSGHQTMEDEGKLERIPGWATKLILSLGGKS